MARRTTWREIYIENNPHLLHALQSRDSLVTPKDASAEETAPSPDPSETSELEPQKELSAGRKIAVRILASPWFTSLIHACILTNTMTIAVEQSNRLLQVEQPLLSVIEHVFISLFFAELALRYYAVYNEAFRDGWFWFDSFLVVVAVFSNWVWPLAAFISKAEDQSMFGVALVLRAARLARLARAFRLVHEFSNLWLLVHAFLNSARMVGYVFAVMALVLYIFNALALELIPLRYMEMTDVPDHIQEIVNESFPSLGGSMLTLVQFVCLDSIGAIYRPLALYDWVLAIYFVGLLLVVGIVLMNVITAVIVNSALNHSNEDKELVMVESRRRKEKLIESLWGMFIRLDKDKSGQITLNELEKVQGDDAKMLAEFSEDMDPKDIFNMLDIDKSGSLGIYEFCEGLYEVVVGESRVELRNLTRHVHHISKHINLNREVMAQMQADLRTVVYALAEKKNAGLSSLETQSGLCDVAHLRGGMNTNVTVTSNIVFTGEAAPPIFVDLPPCKTLRPDCSLDVRGADCTIVSTVQSSVAESPPCELDMQDLKPSATGGGETAVPVERPLPAWPPVRDDGAPLRLEPDARLAGPRPRWPHGTVKGDSCNGPMA